VLAYNEAMKREIMIGSVGIGGSHPVSVQTMTKVPLNRIQSTLNQIGRIADAGAELVRIGIPDRNTLKAFTRIVRESPLPVIADIHFDGDLALYAMEAGAAALRINPGNIGGNEKLKEILRVAGRQCVPIRIGANSGSLEKKYAQDDSLNRSERLVRSVLDRIRFCEDQGFTLLKISLKSSSVLETIEAYRMIDRACDYPLHVGITESGPGLPGIVKSVLGIGVLLEQGIGNTIRVSLTASPEEEVRVAREILAGLDLRRRGIELVACPTCSRTSIDLIGQVRRFQKMLGDRHFDRSLKVAIMGCEVNGPGEAADADIGVAFSKGKAYLFQRGEKMERVAKEDAMDILVQKINTWMEENE